MPNRPSLPTETCERIIDFLRQDPKSLYSCLLTCRDWVPRARYYFYTSVRLSTPTGLSNFLRSLHSNPGNAQYVHCLSLGSDLHHSSLATQDDDDDDDELMVTAVVRLPRILTSLREIKIIRLPTNMHATFPRLLSQFQATTQLSLDSTTFTSFNEFKRHIIAFPNLKHLCLINTTWTIRNQPITSPVDRRSRPALEHVKIYYESVKDEVMEDIIKWLSTTSMSTLAELSVGPLHAQSAPTFNNLLFNCRNSLHTLEIYCRDSDEMLTPFNNINLRKNLALRDLRIYDVRVTTLAFLLLIAPPSLRSLSIRALCDFRPEPDFVDDFDPAWKEVTSALTSGRFQDVETVRIGLVDRLSEVVIFGHGLRRLPLPKLHPRVILTDYSKDDLHPYRTKIDVTWTMSLNKVFGYSNPALATSQAIHNGVWTFIYTIFGKQYGRGTDKTLNDAKEIAAYHTYCIWLKEFCACPPDEYIQKYKYGS